MKELDYEDWQKNPTPRKMWVWNDEEEKVQKKVLYIFFIEKGKNGKYQRYLMMKHVLIFTSIVQKLKN